MNRVQDIQLITALITDLKPNTEERAAILRAFETKQIASRESADETDDAMRLARELATPILWSDVRGDCVTEFARRVIAFQADEWSLPWQVERDTEAYSPVATLCLPSTFKDDRARPLTFYDLWRAFPDRRDLFALGNEFARFEDAFKRKCGRYLYPPTPTVVGTNDVLLFWKRNIVSNRQKHRLDLGDATERFAKEKIRERFGWYSPNDLLRK